MASALCEGSMPDNSERQIQSRFKFVSQGHFAEKSKKQIQWFARGPCANVDLDSHLSVTDRCRSLVHIFRVGPVAAGAKASALCEGSMPDNSERQIQNRFKFLSQGHFAEKKNRFNGSPGALERMWTWT